MINDSLLLKDLLILTKDGEWGKDKPDNGFVEMSVIRGTDFEDIRFGDTSSIPVRYIPEQVAIRKRLQPNDILLETAGGTKDQPTGRTVFLKGGIFKGHSRDFTCASFSRFLRVNTSIAFPEYIYWYLKYLYLIGEMYLYHVQHTGVARFQYTEFASKTKIPLPPLPEQRAIARILGALDDKIELNRKMNATLEALARAIFTSWFVDFDPVRAKAEGRAPDAMDAATAALFPDAFEEIDGRAVPRGWSIDSFATTINLIGGGTPKTSEPAYWDGEIPWFSVADIPSDGDMFTIDTEKKITQRGLDESTTRLLSFGTTIISARGTVGKCALVGVPMAMNQSCYGVTGTEGRGAYFTNFLLRHLVTELQRSTHGSIFDTITRDTFRLIRITVVPVQLTQVFDITVSPFLQRILANLHQSRTLAALRDSLLPRLLSGELRVRDAERLAAEQL